MTGENEPRDERMIILEMIDSGKISASEGLNLLQLIAKGISANGNEAGVLESESDFPQPVTSVPAQEAEVTVIPPPLYSSEPEPRVVGLAPEPQIIEPSPAAAPVMPAEAAKFRRLWMIPFWGGAVLAFSGALMVYGAWQAYAGLSLWLFMACIPFGFGLLFMLLGWQSRSARWLYLRVQQPNSDGPKNIVLTFPLPLRLTAWFLRIFKPNIPGVKGTSLDELITALDKTASPETPFYLEVDDDEDGEHVKIYIG
jgi:hypothetical protein